MREAINLEPPTESAQPSGRRSVKSLAAVLPPLEWLPRYERSWLMKDAVAGDDRAYLVKLAIDTVLRARYLLPWWPTKTLVQPGQ